MAVQGFLQCTEMLNKFISLFYIYWENKLNSHFNTQIWASTLDLSEKSQSSCLSAFIILIKDHHKTQKKDTSTINWG